MSMKLIGQSIHCEKLTTFLATNKQFYNDVENCNFRNYGLVDYDSRILMRMIKESDLRVEIIFKKTKNPWSSANGWCYPPKPIIYLNSRRDWTYIQDFTYTVVHELIHLIGIDHGSNTLKRDCPHEVVAQIARRLI